MGETPAAERPGGVKRLARRVFHRLPGPVAEVIRSTVRAGSGAADGRGRAHGTYSTSFRVGHHEGIDRPWPDPPAIERPFEPVHPAGPEEHRSYDVALFEALNAEYASRPIVPAPPTYDPDSMTARSRGRISGIHDRIGLAGMTTLEVGCGAGYEVWYLAHHFGCDAWGIDVTPRRAWAELGDGSVHLIEGDMAGEHGLPLGAFDRVVSFTVWEHVTRPREALVELHRVMKPGGLAWIRANLYRGPTASHLYRFINFPFPHLLFHDDVIAEALRRAGKPARGAAWVNRLTWEQYEAYMLQIGFRIRALQFDTYPLDEPFYLRFEDILGRYPRADLERGFFTVLLEKAR